MAAFTFGNVHGAYKPGVVRLRPSLLGDIQARVARAVAEGELPSAAGASLIPPTASRLSWCSTAAPVHARKKSPKL